MLNLNKSLFTLFRSLSHRSFALLWSGQTVSRLGDSLYRIALAWWVLDKTGSAAIMGTVLIFSTVPMLVFLLIGGVFVDRFNRARLMLISDLSRGVLVAIVTTLALTGRLEVWHIFLTSTIFGLVNAFFQPAYTSIVPDLTPREALPSANSLTSLSGQIAGILGPAFGAVVIAAGGTPIAFGMDAVSFFISAVCLLPLLKTPAPHTGGAGSSGLFAELRDGIRTVFASPWLWITISVAALGNIFFSGSFNVALPFLVKDDLQGGVDTLGAVFSLLALGTALGTLWTGRYSRLRRRGLTGYGLWILSGLMIAVMGFSHGIVFVGLAALICGAAIAIFELIWINSLQELVPREQLGRVSSIDYLGSFALLPIGYGLVGWFTDRLGAPLLLVLSGLITVALASLGLTHPAIRNLD